jgi:hypothetical protein
MKILENAIWNNPIGWATKAVGTKARYRYFQFITIILGIFATTAFCISASKTPATGHSAYREAYFIFFCSGLLPLCYLKAMRALYLKGMDKITVNQAAGPDR